MKKKNLSLVALVLATVMLASCGTADAGSAASAKTAKENAASAVSAVSAEENSAEKVAETASDSVLAEAAEIDDLNVPADGVYTAEFETDSSMFHINETLDGKGTLTVEDGKMTMHITLASKNIVNLFEGTAADAQKEGAVLLQPTTDEVTYDDGITEEVYGFDITVPAIDEEFDLALVGTKGKWYDHKVVVSNPIAE